MAFARMPNRRRCSSQHDIPSLLTALMSVAGGAGAARGGMRESKNRVFWDKKRPNSGFPCLCGYFWCFFAAWYWVILITSNEATPWSAAEGLPTDWTSNGRCICTCILLYCIVMYCVVLYCIVSYCIILYWYCIVSYCIAPYCIVLDRIAFVLYCVVLYCNVLCCIVLYRIVLYRIVLYCIVLYCIALYCIGIVLYRIVLYCIVL